MVMNKVNKAPLPTLTTDILESISDGVFTVDDHWQISFFNRAAETITGIPREEALGKLCSEVFKSSMCESDCALRCTLKNQSPIVNKPCFIIDVNGDYNLNNKTLPILFGRRRSKYFALILCSFTILFLLYLIYL